MMTPLFLTMEWLRLHCRLVDRWCYDFWMMSLLLNGTHGHVAREPSWKPVPGHSHALVLHRPKRLHRVLYRALQARLRRCRRLLWRRSLLRHHRCWHSLVMYPHGG
jgi:hypothetical protein